MKKSDRELIRQKFGGRCAYSGTILEPDWQIDHVRPVVRNWFNGTMTFKEDDVLENMVPVQKIINHYKHSLSLEQFRSWYLAGLHLRLKKLPKEPFCSRSIKRKAYMLKVAEYFGITPEKQFSGTFYFETYANPIRNNTDRKKETQM